MTTSARIPELDEWLSARSADRRTRSVRRREIRAELAAARKIGKAKYHRFRLAETERTTEGGTT